jgi:hypothetical protein
MPDDSFAAHLCRQDGMGAKSDMLTPEVCLIFNHTLPHAHEAAGVQTGLLREWVGDSGLKLGVATLNSDVVRVIDQVDIAWYKLCGRTPDSWGAYLDALIIFIMLKGGQAQVA